MENIISSFVKSVQQLKDNPCLWFEVRQNTWQNISWLKFFNLVSEIAFGLRQIGLKPDDKIAIIGPTAWQWSLADMSILTAGCVCVPIYQTLPTQSIRTIIVDSDVKLVIGDPKFWKNKNINDIDFLSWNIEGDSSFGSIVSKKNSNIKNNIVEEAVKYPLNKIATIVYTSGTTGEPKGAIITHKNISAEISSVRKIFLFPHDYVGIACLPFSHVLGRMMQFYQLAHGCQTAYVPDLTRLPDAYKYIKPHYLCAVPRLLEKVEEGANEVIAKRPLFERKVFEWSKKVANDFADISQWGHKISLKLKLKYLISYLLIYRRIRKALGGRIKAIICGGAPLSANLARLLYSSKINLLEGYGLTETFAAVTVNRIDDFRFSTVGKPIEDAIIKFSSDNELLIKGPIIFEGYWKKESLTKQTFTEDGWFKTGDLGEFTRDGFIRLTGRKKDIIITSGGKNITPTIVEDKLKEISFINQVVLYGDGKKYLTAILVIDSPRMLEEANRLNLSLDADLTKCKITRYIIENAINEKNKELASFEQIKKFIITTKLFSIETGELTPTLKIRRDVITNRFKQELEELY